MTERDNTRILFKQNKRYYSLKLKNQKNKYKVSEN